MQSCPYCENSEKQIKSGKTRCGTQRYLCRHCEKTFSIEKKKQGYTDEVREKAVRMYVEGNNFRRIGRLLGVNHQSVVNWVNAFQGKTEMIVNSSTETIEIDELCNVSIG
jgi:transposase-like protein